MIDTMLIILVVFLLIMISAIITFGIMFVYKKRLIMKFIMADKSLVSKTIHGNVTKEQKYLDGVYIIDDTCIIKKFWGNEIYYYHGNPNPLNFDASKSFNNIIGTKAQDLKTFHDSDLIQKLFATENLDKLIMILLFVNIALTIGAIISSYMSKGPVELSNSVNNTQVIVNAVKIAIKGG